MEKKLGIIFVIFVVAIVGMYAIGTSKRESGNEGPEIYEENDNNIFGFKEINSVKLYKTDNIYNEETKGYVYKEITLSDEDINNIKSVFENKKFDILSSDVVYGIYKLNIDGVNIFFDGNTASALYVDNNYTFELPIESQKKILGGNYE